MSILSDPEELGPAEGTQGELLDSEKPGGQAVENPPITAPPTETATPEPSREPVTAEPALSQDELIDEILRGAIGEIGEASCLKVLIYGPPGSTKSSMLGDIPNNIILDLEGGLISAKTAKLYTGRDLAPNVKAYPYKDFDKAVTFVNFLKDGKLPEFEVLSVDTVSDMHKREIQAVTERGHSARPSKSLYVPETEDYTEVNEKLTRFIRTLRDMDRHLVILGHSQTVEPKGKAAKTYLDFSEKLTNKLLAMMDVVGYIEMREFQDAAGEKVQAPVMRVISDGTVYAKTRIPLPAEIINPRWVDIYNAWEAAKADGTLSEADSADALAAELMS